MSQEIYDIFAADEKASDQNTPVHEKSALKTEIQGLISRIENNSQPAQRTEKIKKLNF